MLHFRVLLGASVLAVAAGFAACAGTGNSTRLGIVTGVVVRAETLTTGRGCGTLPTQVFKYAVVVYGKNADDDRMELPLGGGVFDCFTDGAFVNLPVTNGSSTYRLDVRIYNKDVYDASVQQALASLTTIRDAGDDYLVEQAAKDAVTAFSATPATWTTTCTATQFNLVQSLAVCEPILAVGASRVTLPTSSFLLADGGVTRCVPSSNGGVDAGDAGDAGDGGDDAGSAMDAGADAAAPPAGSTFRSLRVQPTFVGEAGAAPGNETSIPCGMDYAVVASPETSSVSIGVTLVGEADAAVGQTTCRANTSPSTVNPAVCDPAQ